MEFDFFNFKTPRDIQLEIAKNVKLRRKEMKMTQEQFAKVTGVSLGSIKRFENTGEISLLSLSKIAIILGRSDEMFNLFSQRHYNSIEEILNEHTK